MEKKLKVVLVILLMVLLSVIGFGGIYLKNNVAYKNILPDYELGTNLEGTRVTTLKVDDSTEEVIYDAEGKIVEEIPEGADETTYRKEQVAVNAEENKNSDNYKKVKNIMLGRLNDLGIQDYEVRLNEENGIIEIALEDSTETDSILSSMLYEGKFEVMDTESGNVLMNNDDLESTTVLYNSTVSGIVVYLDIKFTDEGKEKFEKISREYVAVEKTEEQENESEENEEESKTERTITIEIDGETFMTTAFEEPITNGQMTVSIGSATSDSTAIDENIAQAQYFAMLLDNEKMPLTYDVEATEYIESVYSNEMYMYIALGIIAGVVLLSLVYMVIKYKKLGLLSSVVYIATIAILTIIMRLLKAEIALEAIISIAVLILLNNYINCNVLKNLSKEDNKEERSQKLNKAYIKVIDVLIVTLIPAIVFIYNSFSVIASIGMIVFWGIISIVLMNILFTRTLLMEEIKK